MSELRQVKVDNWGIYFLQRLKHFFNRTDYCDLTLQFQDNAQLKVHRLVLNACTEYFEVLERTCEMYEDCLVMPDDLQADVVVPIVNFMYTGQLEFRLDLLEKLYQTSLIMKMPVLTKLLKAHRASQNPQCYAPKHKSSEPTPSTSNKRSYGKAFDNKSACKEKKVYKPVNINKEIMYRPSSPYIQNKKNPMTDPKPTRYELSEEFDGDGVFDSSFCNISYTSQPLMVHPDTKKRYSKKSGLFNNSSSDSKHTTTLDIIECKKSVDNIFEDNYLESGILDENEMFQTTYLKKNKPIMDSNQLFDQILDQNDAPKITIDTKNSKVSANLDHAKIISEVLKKYSHLLKGSKNIKLKILNTPNKKKQSTVREQKNSQQKVERHDSNFTYETDVIDSKHAAKLIAMGAENINGPWICLICGTPGKALHFMSYYKFRRHLVEVHNEKPVVNICEYCGYKALKRNYHLYHLYTKHGIEPPPTYNFPKCNQCNYVAMGEGYLMKHKLTHSTVSFQCNVCATHFSSSNLLLQHIQRTGHKYSAERKHNLQCMYCLKVFLRESSLYNHLKTCHKKEDKSSGIIDDSDEEKSKDKKPKLELEIEIPPVRSHDYEEVNVHYQIQPDGNIHVIPNGEIKAPLNQKHKILNPEFNLVKPKQIYKENSNIINNVTTSLQKGHVQEDNSNVITNEEIVMIDDREYILKDNQLIPRSTKNAEPEFIIPEMLHSEPVQQTSTSTTQLDYTNLIETVNESNVILSKQTNLNQPIQFVVSNEEEYKALMTANHPILFDNGDSNKTLAVLSNPHTSNVESTSMELDNTQSNDIMIIQENYPLNVTESVVTDNSNIVVVYSHPVDSTNKQFQILTTQGIGTQLIQSSAIITQNFETVTTTAPVMNAHVIESQEWENDITPMPVSNKPNADLEKTGQNTPQMTSHQSVIVSPEVQVPPKPPSPIDMDVEETIQSKLINEPIQENNEKCTQSETLPATTITPITDSSNPTQGKIVENMIINEQLTEESRENLPTVEENLENIDKNSTKSKLILDCNTKMGLNDISENLIDKEENICSPTFTQQTDLSLENNVDSISQDSAEEIVQCEVSLSAQAVPKAAEEKIQILTSEWSEDEYDSPPAINDNKVICEDSKEILTKSTETPQNIEEGTVNTESLLPENLNEPTESAKPESPNKQTTKIPNDNISSLLSDWEDSQEDLSSNDENIDNILPKEYEEKLRNDLPDYNIQNIDRGLPNLNDEKDDEDLIKVSKEKVHNDLTNADEKTDICLTKDSEGISDSGLPKRNREEMGDPLHVKQIENVLANINEGIVSTECNNRTEKVILDEPNSGLLETAEKKASHDPAPDNETDKPDDKIKSLVSDWDDDDEESKIN